MGLSSPKTPITPIPAQADFETQIDNVAGTKVERVKQPDGTYATVRSALPLSAEDQALQDTYKGIAQSSLDWMTKLSTDYNPDDIPWLKDYLADYKATNLKAINDNAASTATSDEKALARFGQADSTAAAQARSARFGVVSGQKDQLSRDMSGIAQTARDSELSKQGSLYSLATGALNQQSATQIGSLANLVSSGLTQQGNTQNFNNSVAATIGSNNAAKAASQQAGFNNLVGLASLAAAPFTGGASLAVPGLFGAAGGGASAGASTGLSSFGGWNTYGDGTRIKWS
ncbi:hypothetical protein [Mesorhizobium sp. B2-3-10]|uniref:hypothetical protein n=1 Tax=Mesorhizobium sp. B2-3-10 TaxID=2589954 RepID=UPI00112A4ECD|nr:hypothetical protein [Mesorhizobium sp. B2-3-10]TPL98324.1 hypothetical protein FJ943_15580 [Mesorhizobium sp. B2-3-10]